MIKSQAAEPKMNCRMEINQLCAQRKRQIPVFRFEQVVNGGELLWMAVGSWEGLRLVGHGRTKSSAEEEAYLNSNADMLQILNSTTDAFLLERLASVRMRISILQCEMTDLATEMDLLIARIVEPKDLTRYGVEPNPGPKITRRAGDTYHISSDLLEGVTRGLVLWFAVVLICEHGANVPGHIVPTQPRWAAEYTDIHTFVVWRKKSSLVVLYRPDVELDSATPSWVRALVEDEKRYQQWLRDLTVEGVEPNPGPKRESRGKEPRDKKRLVREAQHRAMQEEEELNLCHAYVMNGTCGRPDCPFDHPIEFRRVCRLFAATGRCNFGARCRYEHVAASGSKRARVDTGPGACAGRRMVDLGLPEPLPVTVAVPAAIAPAVPALAAPAPHAPVDCPPPVPPPPPSGWSYLVSGPVLARLLCHDLLLPMGREHIRARDCIRRWPPALDAGWNVENFDNGIQGPMPPYVASVVYSTIYPDEFEIPAGIYPSREIPPPPPPPDAVSHVPPAPPAIVVSKEEMEEAWKKEAKLRGGDSGARALICHVLGLKHLCCSDVVLTGNHAEWCWTDERRAVLRPSGWMGEEPNAPLKQSGTVIHDTSLGRVVEHWYEGSEKVPLYWLFFAAWAVVALTILALMLVVAFGTAPVSATAAALFLPVIWYWMPLCVILAIWNFLRVTHHVQFSLKTDSARVEDERTDQARNEFLKHDSGLLIACEYHREVKIPRGPACLNAVEMFLTCLLLSRYKERLSISVELLSQLVTYHNVTDLISPKDMFGRIDAFARTRCTVPVNRFGPVTGRDEMRATVHAAFVVAMSNRRLMEYSLPRVARDFWVNQEQAARSSMAMTSGRSNSTTFQASS